MADPAKIECKEAEWTKIADGVLTGFISKALAKSDFNFFWTSRDHGGTLPKDGDSTDGGLALPLFQYEDREKISSTVSQDFYVWVKNTIPGIDSAYVVVNL